MKNKHLAVIGLGYVGLPVAVAFSQKFSVTAFDINSQRVTELQQGYDKTGEVPAEKLSSSNLTLTSDPNELKQANVYIITVPTPVNEANQPDFEPLVSASRIVGAYLKQGDIVIYESTVYPGATEEVCGSILEQSSGLVSGVDFFLAYSPERINPGDKQHGFTDIVKVVSGCNPATLETVAELYAAVVRAGVYRASSIKVAEAAKVLENTQRDLNIALINEVAVICNRLQIDTTEVLEAAATKWNFLPFKPGLVGGHCIGVDPYYLTYKAEMLGYHPELILAGRRINDAMGQYIAQQVIKCLIHGGVTIKNARIGILGLTFKENCPDIRGSKVFDLIEELRDYGVEVWIHDPLADPIQVQKICQLPVVNLENLPELTALVLAVPHQCYLQQSILELIRPLGQSFKLLVDVKSALDRQALTHYGVTVWRL